MNLNLNLKRGVSWIHIAPDSSSKSSRDIGRGTVNEESRSIPVVVLITLSMRRVGQQELYASLEVYGDRFVHPSSEIRRRFTSLRGP